MAIQTRLIEYTHDNQVFDAYFAWDDTASGPRAGVAVAHTWAGRGEFEQNKARELAAMGYVAMALDVYGQGLRGGNAEQSQALMTPLLTDRKRLQARLLAALECFAEQNEADAGRLCAIGYCFGGLCVLDLARIRAPVRSVVSVHGLFTAPPDSAVRSIDASVLCLHGYDDPMATPEAMLAFAAEMSSAGADWQVHAYGNTLHAFTNPAADNAAGGTLYSPVADRRSWQALGNFLEETLS